MKKMKALLLSLVLGLSVTTAIAAVGCKKAPPANSSNWFTEESGDVVTVRFANGQVDVLQYESVQLVCMVKGSVNGVKYTSSDESVATVDANGIVTAKGKLGDAIITATVEDVSATCTVSVKESPYAPQIVLASEEYTIEEGDTLQFNVATQWNKTELTEAIDYAVSFAEDSQDADAEISVDGDLVTIVGKSAGSFNVVVSTTVRGQYTSEMITVNVVGAKLKLQPKNMQFQPTSTGYEANISTTDLFGDLTNSLALEFDAVKGSKTFDGVSIAWTLKNTDTVTLNSDSVVKGQKKGTATVTGTVECEGETATVEVVFNVLPPEVRLEETTTLEVENLVDKYVLTSDIVGTLDTVELHGVDVSSRTSNKTIVFNKDAFPKQAELLGEQEFVVNTDVVRYIMPVTIYTMVINDAAELDKMREIANTGETEWSIRFGKEVNSQYYDGYFVLGNDIKYNKVIKSMTDTGTVWGVQGSEEENTRGFKGIFDGMGFNIDGVTVGNNPSGDKKQSGGIFGYLSTKGIVRNVSFTNAVLYDNQAFLCARGDGLIENVSVSYKQIGGLIPENDRVVGNPMGTFFTKGSDSHATVRNCLIDATAADIVLTENKGAYNIKLAGGAKITENVIALCPDDLVLGTSGADMQKKSYVDLVADPAMFTNFDRTIWTTVEGVPMFANLAVNLDRDADVDFLNVDPTIVAGFDMVIRATNPYVKIEMVEPVEGVTFENSLLSAKDVAFKKVVTLKVTSLFNAEKTATMTVTVDSYGTKIASPATENEYTVYDLDPVLKIGDNSWIGDADIVYVYLGKDIVGSGTSEIVVDWTACDWGKNDATIVLVHNLGEDTETREHFNVNMKVWFTSGDQTKSQKIADTVFAPWLGYPTGEHFTEVTSDIEAPAGYTSVTRRDCGTEWGTAMGSEYLNEMDVSAYRDIWFALKVTNARYVFQTVTVTSGDWVYFHYTQVSDGVWVAEVTVDKALYTTEFNIHNTKIREMLYRSGWGNGFLIYNNQGSLPEGGTTSVYTTEILGILK